MLSEEVVEGDEAYEFTWVGKKAAIVEANSPIRKTLRPCQEESVHWDTTQNLYIEGDNLEVLKLLQESYLGKVKLIYIDPPYNTGNDFIYQDDFKMSIDNYSKQIEAFDEIGNRMFKNTDNNGRFHSDWCSMMYSRLLLARNLLCEDGMIFISIDDNELEDLLKIGSELFGHYLACFPRVTKKAGKTTDTIAKNHDYVIAYGNIKPPKMYLPTHTDDGFKYCDEYVNERGLYKLNQTLDYDSLQYSPSLDYPLEIEDLTLYPGGSYEKYLERKSGKHARADWAWRWSKELVDFGYKNGFIVIKRYDNYARVYTKTYQNARIVKKNTGFEIEQFDRTRAISSLEFIENEFSNDNSKKNLAQLFTNTIFDYSKPVSLLNCLVKFSTTHEDIVLDFFSGSATTAHAVMLLNAQDNGQRKFIMVQLPEKTDEKSEAYKAGYDTICEIGKERIRRAAKKIHKEFPNAVFDDGFRVLKLDDTNMKDVYYAASDYNQNMLDSLESTIKEDRTDLDLLFGCLLEWGLPLSKPYTSETIDGCTIHIYNGGDLIVCFEKTIPNTVIKAIAKRQPLRVVFCDSSFTDSPEKMNVYEIFKLLAPDTMIKIM